jgi:hypothetical protein
MKDIEESLRDASVDYNVAMVRGRITVAWPKTGPARYRQYQATSYLEATE